MTGGDLDTLHNLRESFVKRFDDTMDSKTDLIKWVNARFNASRKEAFSSSDTKYSRAVRETTELIDDYENLYESTDVLYTNQRKMQFQVEEYERIRTWRWILFLPYYVIFGMVVFAGDTHYVLWVIYATLPFWVDWLVEMVKRLGYKTSGILYGRG